MRCKIGFRKQDLDYEYKVVDCGELKCYDFDQNTNRFTIIGSFKTLSFEYNQTKFNPIKHLIMYLNGKLKTRTYNSNLDWEKSDIKITYSIEQIKAIMDDLREGFVLSEEITLGEDEQKLLNGKIELLEKDDLDIKLHFDFLSLMRDYYERRLDEKDEKLAKELKKIRDEIDQKIEELGGSNNGRSLYL